MIMMVRRKEPRTIAQIEASKKNLVRANRIKKRIARLKSKGLKHNDACPHKLKPHYAHGMCKRCYNTHYIRTRRKVDPEFKKARNEATHKYNKKRYAQDEKYREKVKKSRRNGEK